MLQLIRAGTKPEEILLVCPSVERQRAQLETALSALEVPYAIEGRIRIGKTAFGQALLSFLRFEWLAGGRHDLYGFLRSPFSGLTRAHVDYLEGRLRGRGVSDPARVVEETLKLRGQPLRMLDAFRDEPDPLEAVRALVRSMVRSAYGLEAPPVGPAPILDLRAHRAVNDLLDELSGWVDLGGAPLPRGALRRARPGHASARPRRRAGTGRGHRPPPRANAPNRGRLPARPGGGKLPPSPAGLALPRRRGAPRRSTRRRAARG